MQDTTARQSVYHQKMLDKGFKKRAFYVSQETLDYLTKYKIERKASGAYSPCITMAIETVRAFLKEQGLEGRIHEFDSSSATVALAAEALGTEPARIAKTLSFVNGDTCILIVAAGDAKIDNRKFKDFFGRKATMLAPDEVLRLPVDEALVILRGHKVLKVHKMDYSLHPAYKQLRECKASAHIPEWRKVLPETLEAPPAETAKASPKVPPRRRGRPAKSKAVVATDKESIITKPENEKEIPHGNEQ